MVKWIFKKFVRAVSLSVVYNFFLYTGKIQDKKVTRASVVEYLPKTPSETKNSNFSCQCLYVLHSKGKVTWWQQHWKLTAWKNVNCKPKKT